jgi:hypothetical protein
MWAPAYRILKENYGLRSMTNPTIAVIEAILINSSFIWF